MIESGVTLDGVDDEGSVGLARCIEHATQHQLLLVLGPWDHGPISQHRKLQPLPLRHSLQVPVKTLVIKEDQLVA